MKMVPPVASAWDSSLLPRARESNSKHCPAQLPFLLLVMGLSEAKEKWVHGPRLPPCLLSLPPSTMAGPLHTLALGSHSLAQQGPFCPAPSGWNGGGSYHCRSLASIWGRFPVSATPPQITPLFKKASEVLSSGILFLAGL
jgi:hypothetical protein